MPRPFFNFRESCATVPISAMMAHGQHISPLTNLSDGAVHVWAWDAARMESAERLSNILSLEERCRAARFRQTIHRRDYAVAHVNMRLILGRYLGVPPENVRYISTASGKPQVVLGSANTPIQFSLSHTQAIGFLAISHGAEIGIDTEFVRPISRTLASVCFSPYELAQLEALGNHSWLEGFYRCWTCKEAVLKGEGTGLTLPLDSFDIDFTSRARPYVAGSTLPIASLFRWHLFPLGLMSCVVTSLAVSTYPNNISLFRLIA